MTETGATSHQHTTIGDAFRPPGDRWVPVSPKLAVARRIVLLGVLAIPAAVAAVLALAGELDAAAALGVPTLVVLVWVWWLIGRRVRSIGYAERADDLLVTSGIMFRRLVVVPYGRMQLVDLTAGPLDRAFGIATVQLHTAAATTDATIPGLAPDDAAALRDRLAARGEERTAGL